MGDGSRGFGAATPAFGASVHAGSATAYQLKAAGSDHSATMDPGDAETVLRNLKDDHPYPAMVVDRILIDVQRAHGHAAVNRLIDACDLVRRFGIRKVWPDAGR